MASYSTDDDLRKYLSSGDYSLLPLPLDDLHTEAGRQLDLVLIGQGWTDDDLLILTAATLAAMREVAALNVLAMFFRRFGDLLDRADRFAHEYRTQLAAMPVATTSAPDTPVTARGYVVLG